MLLCGSGLEGPFRGRGDQLALEGADTIPLWEALTCGWQRGLHKGSDSSAGEGRLVMLVLEHPRSTLRVTWASWLARSVLLAR